MIRVDVSTLQFNPQQGCYFIPAVEEVVPDAGELRLAISEGRYQDALDYIPLMHRKALLEPDVNGQTALHWAVIEGHQGICQTLLEKIGDEVITLLTKQNKKTVLHFAALYGNQDCAELLIEKVPSLVDIPDSNGQLPMHVAFVKNDLKLFQTLYNQTNLDKITLPLTSKQQHTILHEAVIRANYLNFVRAILQRSNAAEKLMTTRNVNLQTPLHLAVAWLATLSDSTTFKNVQQKALLDIVDLLLGTGNIKDVVGMQDAHEQTALHWAASYGSSDICFKLCKKMNPQQIRIQMSRTTRRQTALHFAVQGGHQEVVSCLLEAIRGEAFLLTACQDAYGQTALHWAAGDGAFEICRILCSYMRKEDIKLPTSLVSGQQTALHFAVRRGDCNIVKLLLERSGDDVRNLTKVQDINGQTALHWAADNGMFEICHILCQFMSPVQLLLKSTKGQTALHLALYQKSIKVVDLLLGKQQELAKEKDDQNNLTPLEWIKANDFPDKEAVKSMLERIRIA